MRFLSLPFVLLICVLSCSRSPEGEPRNNPEYELRTIVVALDTFAEDCDRYPSSAEGLAALLKRSSQIPEAKWKGPYLDRDSVPLDRWGHAYVYHCPSAHNTNQFDLYSRGPDGVSKSDGNDPDDVNYWNLKWKPGH